MSASDRPISIAASAAALSRPFEMVDLATANDAIVRLSRVEGEFPWHHHDEDELFLCWSGSFVIELEGRAGVRLSAGELFVVPAGLEHRPVANEGPAYSMVLEKPQTQQYGNA